MGITCAYPNQDTASSDEKLKEIERPEVLTPRPSGTKKEVIFIWNIEVFTSLMSEPCDEDDKRNLIEKLDSLLLNIAETRFNYEDLKDFALQDIYDNPYLDTGQDSRLSPPDSIPVDVIPKYNSLVMLQRKTKENFCKACSANVEDLISNDREQQWLSVKQNIDALKDKWLTEALHALQIIKARSACVNILLTTGHLIPALSFVLVMNLQKIFSIENIYSTTKVGKEKCLQSILNQFGGESNVFVFGVDKEDEKLAEKLKMAFWKVEDQADIDSLHHALKLNYL